MLEPKKFFGLGDKPSKRKEVHNAPEFAPIEAYPPVSLTEINRRKRLSKKHQLERERQMWESYANRTYAYIANIKEAPTVADIRTYKRSLQRPLTEMSAWERLDANQKIRSLASQLLAHGEKDSMAFWQLVRTIDDILQELTLLAMCGHSGAINASHQIAYKQVLKLRQLTDIQLKAVQSLAARQHDWPDFISPHSDSSKHIHDRISKIKLGTRSYQKLTGKGKHVWSATPSPGTGQKHRHVLHAYIERLVNTVISIRRRPPYPAKVTLGQSLAWFKKARALPPSPEMDKDQWWAVCLELLKDSMRAHPEAFADLVEVGKFRADVWQRAEASKKVQLCQAKHGIYERLKKTFYNRIASAV